MFENIKEYFFRILNDKRDIKLEDIEIFSDKKISMVVSHENYMASFEILANYIYDFILINTNSEKIIYSKTKDLKNMEQLCKEIYNDFQLINNVSMKKMPDNS